MFGLNFLLEGEENKDEKVAEGNFFDFPLAPAVSQSGYSQESFKFETKFTVGEDDHFTVTGKEKLGFFDSSAVSLAPNDKEMDIDLNDSKFNVTLGNNFNTTAENSSAVKPNEVKSADEQLSSPLKNPLYDEKEGQVLGSILEANNIECEITSGNGTPQKNHQEGSRQFSVTENSSHVISKYEFTPKIPDENFEYEELKMDGPSVISSTPSKSENLRRNSCAGVTPKKCLEKDESSEEHDKSDGESDRNWNDEIQGNPSEFIQTLRNQLGSTEEFGQFERFFYSLTEEVKMLRGNVESLRSVAVKSQEEKRLLELQLVSERALRDQDSKNAVTDLEKNNMQLNTQIYSMKCEVETWKRKAEATQKECGWLKQQLKTLELEKTEAVRKLGDVTRQSKGMEQYRASIESYAKRQREAMADIQKRLMDLEKAREGLAVLTEHNQKQVNFMAVHLKNRENARLITEKRIADLEAELIKAKGELVQNNAELLRTQVIEKKTTDLMNKLVTENRDLHCGLNLVLSSFDNNINKTNIAFIDSIEKLHSEVEESVKRLQVDESSQ